VGEFELIGGDESETRLLRERTTGYSVPLPGRPVLVAAPDGTPRYDVIVRLRDVDVEHGFRLDTVPSSVDPQALAKALATAYATTRSAKPPNVVPIAQRFRPAGVLGAHATYALASTENDPMIEHLWLLVHPLPSGVWVLYQTTRFRTSSLNQIEWAHLRASILDQREWDAAHPRDIAPALWPESAFARPSGKLELTDAAHEESVAKADAIGPLTDEETLTLAQVLREIAQADQTPRFAVVPAQLQECMRRVANSAPSRAAEAMLRNLERCKTMHDLRGWTWQCAWAIGNRTDRTAAQRTVPP
jgi:hypothetical protein